MLVQKLRLKRGWSQQQLAELSGLSVRTVQRIERGQTAGVESLKSLAAVLDVDLSTLQPETGMNSHPTLSVSADETLAFEHVRKVKNFYVHLSQYVLVISLLAAFNLWRSPTHLWFVWVAFGWGIGVLSHAAAVFHVIPFFGPEWENKQVEKRLGRAL